MIKKYYYVRWLIPFSDNSFKKFCYIETHHSFPISPLLSQSLKPNSVHSQERSVPHPQQKWTSIYNWGWYASHPCLQPLQFRLTHTLRKKPALNNTLTALEGLPGAWRRQTGTDWGNRSLLLPERKFFSLLTVISNGEYLILARMYE